MTDRPKMARTLKTIRVCRDYKHAITGLDFPDPMHYDRRIDRDALVLAPEDRIIALLLKNVIPRELLSGPYQLSKLIHDLPDRRTRASGTKSMARILKNGRLGKYITTPQAVVKIMKRDGARQGLFGAERGTAPRLSKLTQRHPEYLRRLRPLVEEVDRVYAKFLPTLYEFQRREAKKASPKFRLWHTAFSSAYMPVHLRSGYHDDDSNLSGGMSMLLSMGDFSGGHLVIPRWRVAFELIPGDLLLFDGSEVHGNTPIIGDRASLVLYCARGLSV